ncbi:hypothetical protein SEA_SUSHI23_261 [Streptomyces phage Sushi23]|uniref:Uncharacterized protein n=1 Tax=Streptomyces phage Sushi23 TaxID=2015806 RepID=A0A222YZF8_9CAUD|nr:hypothetical protein SEA_SUSHI23_261 [Streptomyces phage Sushi23]
MHFVEWLHFYLYTHYSWYREVCENV